MQNYLDHGKLSIGGDTAKNQLRGGRSWEPL